MILQMYRFSLGKKLAVAFAAVSIIVCMAAGTAYYLLTELDHNYSALFNQYSRSMETVAQLEIDTQRQNNLLFAYLLEPSQEKETQLESLNGQLNERIGAIQDQSRDPNQQETVMALADSNATFTRLLAKVAAYVKEGRPDLAKTEALMWSIPLTDTMNGDSMKLGEMAEVQLQNELARNKETSGTIVFILIASSAAALILAVLIGFGLTRMIVRPMRRMVQAAAKLSSGDLTSERIVVRSRDELAELSSAMNDMQSNWRTMIRELGRHTVTMAASTDQVREQAEQFRLSSEQVSVITGEISFGTEQQASSANSGAEAVEQMAEGVGAIVMLAEESNRHSSFALQETVSGEAAVQATARQMNVIREQMNDLELYISQLSTRSEQIVSAAALIANIAKQTQMLALNASIEASRVGELGKGFAVVAGEVRKLSVQTGAAAAEVASVVHGIRSETGSVIQAARSGSHEIAAGLTQVAETGAMFAGIRRAVEEAAGQIGRVSEQAGNLSRQSAAAVAAIRSIDAVAQQTANGSREVYAHTEEQTAGAEQLMHAMDSLSLQAAELRTMIGRFKA
ncbi:methyl-accepting chemotaxis protein [Paenibacillus kobensis]|uniref:methyl-accepting chemotaxis protein n=1 Tax=Paenibacillus kobensis TaxID=59841 RepID=UPI001FEA38EE|nr:methyl-accepting chemotaxis protein [Paenibacillus kobensis]